MKLDKDNSSSAACTQIMHFQCAGRIYGNYLSDFALGMAIDLSVHQAIDAVLDHTPAGPQNMKCNYRSHERVENDISGELH